MTIEDELFGQGRFDPARAHWRLVAACEECTCIICGRTFLQKRHTHYKTCCGPCAEQNSYYQKRTRSARSNTRRRKYARDKGQLPGQ